MSINLKKYLNCLDAMEDITRLFLSRFHGFGRIIQDFNVMNLRDMVVALVRSFRCCCKLLGEQ